MIKQVNKQCVQAFVILVIGEEKQVMKMTPELSKRVGWDSRRVTWPTPEQVESGNDEQILIWHRFLPSATTEEQREIQSSIDRIFMQ